MMLMLWGFLISLDLTVYTAEAFSFPSRMISSNPPLQRRHFLSSCSITTTSLSNTAPSREQQLERDFFFPLPITSEHAMEPLELEVQKQKQELPSKFRSFSKGQSAKQQHQHQHQQRQRHVQKDKDGNGIQCYIVNYEEMQSEGAAPEVHCILDVEEFCWYNGLEVDDLVPTEDLPSLAVDFNECAEGASHRGNPEWECKIDDPDPDFDWTNYGMWTNIRQQYRKKVDERLFDQ